MRLFEGDFSSSGLPTLSTTLKSTRYKNQNCGWLFFIYNLLGDKRESDLNSFGIKVQHEKTRGCSESSSYVV